MIRDRKFYRIFFRMFLVFVLQNVITISVNLLDNIMLGSYRETALAGAAAVNQIQFVYQEILMGFGDGLFVIGAQYFGKKQTEPIRRIAVFAMKLSLAASLILFLLMSFFPGQALSFFTSDAAIGAEGCSYLSIVRFSFPFFAVTQLLLAYLRCFGLVNIGLILSVITLGVNGFLNYMLVFGRFGAPELGAAGAAAATLTARVAEMVILIIYVIRRKQMLQPEAEHRRFSHGIESGHFLKHHIVQSADRGAPGTAQKSDTGKPFDAGKISDAQLIRDYIRIMLPLLLINSLWGMNNAAQNAILGHMAVNAIAANSVASTLYLLVKSTGIGSASTASFLIGKEIGKNGTKNIRQYSRTLQILFLIIGILSGLLLFFLRIPILRLYQLEAGTESLANSFLMILSVIIVGMSYQMPTNSGIIRGGGDTRYCMILDLISIWCIVIPLSLIMAFVVKASPVTVVWCLNADQIFKGIPAFFKCNYGKWAKRLTRE